MKKRPEIRIHIDGDTVIPYYTFEQNGITVKRELHNGRWYQSLWYEKTCISSQTPISFKRARGYDTEFMDQTTAEAFRRLHNR